MAKLISVLIVPAALLLPHRAQAHYVWLEREGDGTARIYFGE
jgi:hypothetical protein